MDENQSELIEKLSNIEKRLDNIDSRITTLESTKQVTPNVVTPPAQPVQTPAPVPTNNVTQPITTPTIQPPLVQEKENFELRLGQHWFSRLGTTALVVGIALFLIYTLQYFGPLGKILVGFSSAATIMVLGYFLEKKYTKYGQVLFGGGVALAYFTTYAMHYFEASKIIDNQYLTIGMLAIISLSYFFYMLRYNKEVMAGIALSLIFLTVNLGNIANFSLIMLIMFSVITVGVSASKGWKRNVFIAMVLGYLTIFRWIVSTKGSGLIPQGDFIFILSILTAAFLMYILAQYYLYKDKEDSSFEVVGFVLLNSALYYMFSRIIVTANYLDPTQIMLISFGALNLVLAASMRFLAKLKYTARAYLGIAAVCLFFFIPAAFNDFGTVIGWLLLGFAFTLYGIYKGTIRTRSIGLLIIGLAFFRLMNLSILVSQKTYLLTGLVIFALASEIFSLLAANTPLKSETTDVEKNDQYIQNTYSALSVISIALFFVYAVDGNLLTLFWGLAGFTIPLLGFALHDKFFRRAGLVLLLIAVLKLFLIDLAGMETIFRIISFIVLGLILLLISYGYTKYKEEIGRYL